MEGRAANCGGPPSELRDLRCLLEVDDETGGDARAIGVRAGGVEADIVHLGAQGQMWKQADVYAATKTIGELVVGAAARSNRDARAAKKDLPKWIELGRVTQSQARPEEVCVGVQGNPARGSMVTAEIANDAEPVPAFEVISDGATDAVLIDTARTAQAEVGVTERSVDGLGARGYSENG